jgi:hypothetical protein
MTSPVSQVPPNPDAKPGGKAATPPGRAFALPGSVRAMAPVVPAVIPASGAGTAISVMMAWPSKSSVSMTEP